MQADVVWLQAPGASLLVGAVAFLIVAFGKQIDDDDKGALPFFLVGVVLLSVATFVLVLGSGLS